jgi:hypothetical protein
MTLCPISEPQGSVWRRWDPHVHTPATDLNNQFEGGESEETWERYLAALERQDQVVAIGSTDYFGIRGYKRLRDAKASGRIANIGFIFPNIELRRRGQRTSPR